MHSDTASGFDLQPTRRRLSETPSQSASVPRSGAHLTNTTSRMSLPTIFQSAEMHSSPFNPLSQHAQDRLRDIIDGYTAEGAKGLPGVLYFATQSHGRPIFEHASGLRGIDSPAPMSLDTVFWLASFTKLITSIACMQLVEQGILELDDAGQVESLAPELRDVQVLKQVEGGGFELVAKNSRITLRMLLTHTGVTNPLYFQIKG